MLLKVVEPVDFAPPLEARKIVTLSRQLSAVAEGSSGLRSHLPAPRSACHRAVWLVAAKTDDLRVTRKGPEASAVDFLAFRSHFNARTLFLKVSYREKKR